MRILTNPGSNLGEEVEHDLDIDVTPQKIVVDGISHDTRNAVDLRKVDKWVATAAKHPFVQGTTEAEFDEAFSRLLRKDPEVLAVMTSRQLIGSHDAAVAAAAKLQRSNDKQLQAGRIEVVDTTVTDVGAGLVTLAAAQWRKAGLPLEKVAEACRAFVKGGRSIITVATLENLIKGGRASWLQGWVANFLNVRPLLSFDGGKAVSVGRMSGSADPARRAFDWLAERFEPKKRVWLAIAHGDVEPLARQAEALLKAHFTVEVSMVRALCPSIYLHVGRGGLAVFLHPLDGLPQPLTPPM
ncbi:MAG: DegV family EDD domain-containing protein [Myxococcaceae bacterium]|nr:DegV family EDD domain-containing protein [Myxococcaceae bacterium]